MMEQVRRRYPSTCSPEAKPGCSFAHRSAPLAPVPSPEGQGKRRKHLSWHSTSSCKPLPVAAPKGAQSPPPQQGKKPSVLPAACPGACTRGTASPLPLGTGHWHLGVTQAQHPRQELYLGASTASLAAAMNCKANHSRHTEPLHPKGSAPCRAASHIPASRVPGCRDCLGNSPWASPGNGAAAPRPHPPLLRTTG